MFRQLSILSTNYKNGRKYEKAIILSSGGVDSTTCLSVAVNALGAENVSTASIFYGQKHKRNWMPQERWRHITMCLIMNLIWRRSCSIPIVLFCPIRRRVLYTKVTVSRLRKRGGKGIYVCSFSERPHDFCSGKSGSRHL